MYIKAGSELRLACRVDLGPEGPDEHYRYLPAFHWLIEAT
jgi:hypothetical protein